VVVVVVVVVAVVVVVRVAADGGGWVQSINSLDARRCAWSSPGERCDPRELSSLILTLTAQRALTFGLHHQHFPL
jgi:hypothetical protein